MIKVKKKVLKKRIVLIICLLVVIGLLVGLGVMVIHRKPKTVIVPQKVVTTSKPVVLQDNPTPGIVNYGNGIELTSNNPDVNQIINSPRSFKTYILSILKSEYEAPSSSSIGMYVTVNVLEIDNGTYAIGNQGTVGDYNSNSKRLWSIVNGTWEESSVTNLGDYYRCEDLQDVKAPSALVGDLCYENGLRNSGGTLTGYSQV
jgi:hypothetical protein